MYRQLALTRLGARFRADRATDLPAYLGSMLRGALGHSLRAIGCPGAARGGRPCSRCERPASCVYGALYEPTEEEGRSPGALPPYVIAPPASRGRYEAGDELEMGLVLIGAGRRWLPWVVFALERMGPRGMGPELSPWTLESVAVSDPGGGATPIYLAGRGLLADRPCPELTGDALLAARPHRRRATLRFLTPVLLKDGGRAADRLTGELLVRRLLRRVSELLRQHCGWDPAGFDFRPLIDEARRLRCSADRLRPAEWRRRSNRQGVVHPMDGFLGEVGLGEISESIWPYLVLGEMIHVGKSASFGMGQYALLDPDDLPAPEVSVPRSSTTGS